MPPESSLVQRLRVHPILIQRLHRHQGASAAAMAILILPSGLSTEAAPHGWPADPLRI